MAIFQVNPGLAGCPLNLLLHLFLNCGFFWDRPKLSMYYVLASESRRKGSDAPSLFRSLSGLRKDEVQ